MLVEDPILRADWEEIFDYFDELDYFEPQDVDNGLQEEMIFTMEYENENNTVRSEIIPKKSFIPEISYSVNPQSNDESFMYESDEYRIISRSAPNQLAKSYLENYIRDKNKSVKTESIPILGNEPNSSTVVNSIIEKSFKTVKNMFSGW